MSINDMENKKLEYAIKHSRNYTFGKGNFPDVIPLDFGLDFHLETRPDLYTEIVTHSKTGKRTVTLELNSYEGYCAGAVHWYGTLKAEGVHIIENRNIDGQIQKMWLGGYICEEYKKLKNQAFYESYYNFEILREVTQSDIDKDPQRWEGYHPGDMTNAFNDSKEIIKMAKKIVAVRFPNWNFEIKNI